MPSLLAGALVSCKIRNIADVEPALRSYAHQKMVKVALAACVFSACTVSRALALFREALLPDAPPLTPLAYLTFAVEVPELLPTVAALLVLRRRPISCSLPCGSSHLPHGDMGAWIASICGNDARRVAVGPRQQPVRQKPRRLGVTIRKQHHQRAVVQLGQICILLPHTTP